MIDIKAKAKENIKRIILPEKDPRVLKAIEIAKREKIAEIITVDHAEDERYAQLIYKLREHKGMTLEKARELIKDDLYYAIMLLYDDKADGVIAGATHTTAETLRPALQIIRTHEGLASSYFLMILDKPYLFPDCGFNIKPTPEQLAQIAKDTAKSARFFGIEPKVAFLSFSTHGSGNHEEIDKIKTALEELKKLNPDFIYDGEMQLDAAISPEVAKIKAPDSPLKGEANVLIFPDLNAGNIGYKLVERMGHAKALGPIIQGLKKPVNDLSRGCSVEDIVEMIAITSIQK